MLICEHAGTASGLGIGGRAGLRHPDGVDRRHNEARRCTQPDLQDGGLLLRERVLLLLVWGGLLRHAKGSGCAACHRRAGRGPGAEAPARAGAE